MAFQIDVRFIEPEGKVAGMQSVDISEAGLCISSRHYVEVGTESDLVLELPKQFGSIKVRTKTKWIKKMGETKEYRLGLQFVEMSKEDRKKLKKFLETGGL